MIDPSNDYEVFDQRETIHLQQAGTQIVIAVHDALQRTMSLREVEATQGVYRQGDTRWELPTLNTSLMPAPGDVITASDNVPWTIIEVEKVTLGSRYRCVCRNVVLAEHLSQLIQIQTATWHKDESGAVSASWVNAYTNLPARIQPASAKVIEQHQARGWEVTHQVYVSQPVELNADHRIVCDDRIYHVYATRHENRLDRLQEILVQHTDWSEVAI